MHGRNVSTIVGNGEGILNVPYQPHSNKWRAMDDPAILVAAFDTLSHPLSDSIGEEQCMGRSIAILFRDERDYHDLHFTTEPPDQLGYAYFATPSGRVLDTWPSDEVPVTAKLLLDFHPPGKTITLCWSGRKWTFGDELSHGSGSL